MRKRKTGDEAVSDDDTARSREAFAAKVCKLQSEDSFSEVPIIPKMEQKLIFKGTEDTFSAESWRNRSKGVYSIIEEMRRQIKSRQTKKSIWLFGTKEIKLEKKTIKISSSLEILPQHDSEFIRRAVMRFISTLLSGKTHAAHITLKVTDKIILE